jgi:hypothetical protein
VIARLLLLLVLLAAAVGLATFVAGEQIEVVVLRTYDAEGISYDTKLWVVDQEGTPWVRVANPKRQWFQRLLADPRAELIRNQHASHVVAAPRDTPEARASIDRLFREKYGAIDWWYGVVLRRGAIPIRLDPADWVR